MEAKEAVDKYYFDVKQPYSYGGFSRFASKFPQISKKELKKYLEGEDAFTLHKPIRKKFPTRKTIAPHLDSVWQLDLTDMIKYKSYNEGYRYIPVSYTHLRAHETPEHLVCRLLLEK